VELTALEAINEPIILVKQKSLAKIADEALKSDRPLKATVVNLTQE
jgi:hypothetical protein